MKDFHLDFVGIGPQRNGTTWLHEVLQTHPAICLPQGVKETMFFDQYYNKGIAWYAAHFMHKQESQCCGEIGPTYFDDVLIPQRIYEHNPNCQIIINLRNPIDHALSLYRHHLSKGRISGTFAESVQRLPQIIDSGRYAKHIPKWLDTFGDRQVKFIWLEEIHASPETVFQDVCNFLSISQVNLPSFGQEKVNATRQVRFAWLARSAVQIFYWLRARQLHKIISIGKRIGIEKIIYGKRNTITTDVTEQDRYRLLDQYEPDITYLEKLTSRDLTSWRQIG